MDSVIYVVQRLPGEGSHDPVRVKLNHLLEGCYRLLRSRSENAVLGRSRNSGIKLGGHVKEILERDNILSPCALTQDGGRRNSADSGGGSLAA